MAQGDSTTNETVQVDFDKENEAFSTATSDQISVQGQTVDSSSGETTIDNSATSSTGGETVESEKEVGTSSISTDETVSAGTTDTTSDTYGTSLTASGTDATSATTSVGGSGTQVAGWLSDASKGNVEAVANLKAYTGPGSEVVQFLVANNMLEDAVNDPQTMQLIQNAIGAAGDFGQGIDYTGVHGINQQLGGGLEAYQDPYTEAVTQAGLRDLEEARLAAISRTAGGAMTSGAFGGARHGVADAATNRRFIDQAGDFVNKTRSDAYKQAVADRGRDIDRLMQTDQYNLEAGLQGATTAAELGAAGRDLAIDDAGVIKGIGQDIKDQDYEDFKKQNESAIANATALTNAIMGSKADTTTTQFQDTDTASTSDTDSYTQTHQAVQTIVDSVTEQISSGTMDQVTMEKNIQVAENYMNTLTQSEQQKLLQTLSEMTGIDFTASFVQSAESGEASGSETRTGSSSTETEGPNMAMQIFGAILSQF